MEKETLKYVLAAYTQRPHPRAAPRAVQLPLDSRKVVTLVGIRRSGKTYVLYQTMRRLEAQGVGARDCGARMGLCTSTASLEAAGRA